jgi:hypothetical protein
MSKSGLAGVPVLLRNVRCIARVALSAVAIGSLSVMPSRANDALWQQTSQFKVVGQGHFKYLFWSVYDAQLTSSDGNFQSVAQNKPLALTLTYQREISRDDFVEATLDQWRHLYGDLSAAQHQWGELLKQIWRDVRHGDTLSCVVDEQGHAYFYLNKQSLGDIKDPLFSEQFLAIWLDERTSAPSLRRQLLGI